MNWTLSPDLILYFSIGLILGGMYFYLLFRTVRLHVQQSAPVYLGALYVARIGIMAAAFWAIAQHGALPLLLALLGFLLARFIALGRLRRA